MSQRYVIVGGGIAGWSAAEQIRLGDPDAQITLFSEEHHRLYSRVLLPHIIKEKVPRERVFLKSETWVEEQNIEWLSGVGVISIDTKNQFVAAENGREYEYDKLLVVTGGNANTRPEQLRGMMYLQTLDDADHIMQLLKEADSSSIQAAVLGGGFIAMEFINIFHHFNIPQTIYLRGERFFSRCLDEESSAIIESRLSDENIPVYKNVDVEMLGENGNLTLIRSNGNEVETQLLGIGIGLDLNTHVLQDSGINVDDGIHVNARLQTNMPNVYAAGDVASYFDIYAGRNRRVGNWMNAQMQGRFVGKQMVKGTKEEFALVSSYATNVLGLEIIAIGDTDCGYADAVESIGSKKEGGKTQLFMKDGKLIGATLVNRNSDRAKLTNMIKSQEQKSVDEIKKELS